MSNGKPYILFTQEVEASFNPVNRAIVRFRKMRNDILNISSDEDFIEYLTIVRKCKKSTIRTITTKLTIYLDWLKKQHGQIFATKSFEKFLYWAKTEQNRSPNTLNSYIGSFNNVIDYYDHNEIPHSLKKVSSFKKRRKYIDILTIDEVRKIMDVNISYGNFRGLDCTILNTTYKLVIEVLAITGCRFSEVANLKVNDILFSDKKIKLEITKNGDMRFTFLSQSLVDKLKKYTEDKNPEDYVFTNMMGKKMNDSDFRSDLKVRAKMAGITKRVHPHLFRHSFATEELKNGAKIEEVASLLGHRDIQTTYSTYVHLADTTLEKAASRHPIIRSDLPPEEKIKKYVEEIKALGLENEKDINFSMTVTNGSFCLTIEPVKN